MGAGEQVGTVAEVWRYPVKSLGGERLPRVDVGHDGVPADRGWAFRDEEVGEIRGARNLVGLLQCRARYLREPAGPGDVPPAEITLPDGSTLTTDEPDKAAAAVGEVVGRTLSLHPRPAPDDLELLRRAKVRHVSTSAMMDELRSMFARDPGDPLPDFSAFPEFIRTLVAPPGTFFDVLPLHVVTTSSLAFLAERMPEASIDVRRFRPNVLVDTGAEPALVEAAWTGRRLAIGGVVAAVELATPRCAMITQPQPWAGLEQNRSIMKTVVQEAGQDVGVYLSVEQPGPVAEGDPVVLLPPS